MDSAAGRDQGRVGEPIRRWAIPLGVVLASRAFSIALLVFMARRGTVRDVPLWEIWDGRWYEGIASNGYHGQAILGGYDFAFFPAWPALLKAAATIGIPMPVAGFVGASLLFTIGAVLAWRAIERRMGQGVATSAVALLAFAPPAFVFSIAYAESLFLASAALYFAAPAASRWRVAAAALAVFTRLAGFAVVAAAAVDLLRARGPGRRTAAAAIAAAAVAFTIWWIFVALVTGDAMGYTKGTSAWFQDIPTTAIAATLALYPERVAAWLAFLAAVTTGVALVARRHPDWAAYGAALIVAALLPVIGGGILHSVPRYVLVAFPAYAGLADRLGRRWSFALVIVFAAAQVAFASWVVPPVRTQAP